MGAVECVPVKGQQRKKVTGLGGIFFKAKDPRAAYAWYEKHFGIQSGPDRSGAIFDLQSANCCLQGLTQIRMMEAIAGCI